MDTGIGVLGDATGIGQRIAPAIERVPLGDWKFEQVDIIAHDDVVFDRAVVDVSRFNPFLEDRAADADQLARGGVRCQAKHHGDARITGMAAGEHARAQRVRAVVILDVIEQEGGAVAASLHHPDDIAKFDVPVDFAGYLCKFVAVAQGVNPPAQIAEYRRSTLYVRTTHITLSPSSSLSGKGLTSKGFFSQRSAYAAPT